MFPDKNYKSKCPNFLYDLASCVAYIVHIPEIGPIPFKSMNKN